MGYLYCTNCKKKMYFSRKIGIGTLLLVILSGGFWLLFIPLYSKRCMGCGKLQSSQIWEGKGQPKIKKCPNCAEEIKYEAVICRYCGYEFPLEQGDKCGSKSCSLNIMRYHK